MTTVAVIGVGAMGSRIARRLLAGGHRLVVWNRTAGRVDELTAAGAQAAETPAEAARRAEVAITMVADPAALRAVVEGSDGVASGTDAGVTVIEMSTVGPDAVEWLAAALPPGTGLLDAPVLGSLSEAESGSLSVFVGGPDELVARWTPLLSALGAPMHVGPLGSGAAAKLVANTTLFGVLGLLGEAVALGDALGLDRNAVWDVLSRTPLAAQAERRRGALESGEFPRRFSLSLARKDAELIVAAARRRGLAVPLTDASRRVLTDAEAAGWGDRDYSSVLAWILAESRNPSGPSL